MLCSKAMVMMVALGVAAAGYAEDGMTLKPGASTSPAGTSDEALLKDAQNPVANLISIPYQSNWYFNAGTDEHTTIYVGNLQPVVPFGLSDDWNLITRTIIPIVNQPSLAPGMNSAAGIGDIQETVFFSPVKPSNGFIWGAGPVLLMDTATDDVLGTGKWSAGPSAVVLRMDGDWVYGMLAQQVWSFAGDSDRRSVNQALFQPFVNYNLPDKWYVCSVPIITANWMADESQNVWTVPVGGGFGKLVKFGRLPVNLQVQAFYNVQRPDYAPEWSLRFQAQLLLPASLLK